MLKTTPNASVSPYHHRMPFLIQPRQYTDWLGEAWLQVLDNPDLLALAAITLNELGTVHQIADRINSHP